MSETVGQAGPAGREGQAGPAGREGQAGHVGPDGHDGAPGATGARGATGATGAAGAAGPAGAIIELAEAQEQLASELRALVVTQRRVDAAVTMLSVGVRRLVAVVVTALAVVAVVGVILLALGRSIRDEGNSGRQSLKCVVAVLFSQDSPRCVGVKEGLLRDGILPPDFPNSTTTTRP